MSSQSSIQPLIRDQQRQSIAATEPPQPARMQVTKMLTTKEAAALLRSTIIDTRALAL